MIATVLLLTKKLIDLIKEHFPQLKNYDTLTIDLIEASLNNSLSITDSVIVFSQCGNLDLDLKFLGNMRYDSFRGDNKKIFNSLSWLNRKKLLSRREESGKLGLSSHKRMESDPGESRASLLEAAISPRKTPISPKGVLISESDCNSNNLTTINDISIYCSTEKVQDCLDFFQDNSEYQWFLDYGYKDNSHHHPSIFSVLSSHDMPYYDDLARDLDANLAEVDMDDFHREDIHSVLSSLPNMCNSDLQGVEEREMFASVSESMMIKFAMDSGSHHFTSQEENSNSMSMCKSELLFSPVHESYLPNGNVSVDSLDLSENEINLLITCQANKNNYTIAFEGSTIMGSDDSECPETVESGNVKCEMVDSDDCDTDRKQTGKHNFSPNVNNSMTRSDPHYTTWSKIKLLSKDNLQQERALGGNNNPTYETIYDTNIFNKSSSAIRSLSLPNLFRQKQKQKLGMSISSRFSSDSSSPVDNEQRCIKLYDIQKSIGSDNCDHSVSSAGENAEDRPHNLNLVKLFIKQKSASHEGMWNYNSDKHVCASLCEGTTKNNKNHKENSSHKDCVCNLDATKVKETKSMKKDWITQDKKNIHDSSLTGFEDSLLPRIACKGKALEDKENSDSESVEQITENSKQISESVEQITESYNAWDQLNSSPLDESSHNNHQRINLNSAGELNVNNNNSILGNNKSKYFSDESTQENGSNTESTENVPCTCRKTQSLQNKINVMEKSIQTSKLLETGENNKEKFTKAPAYILYPNYALPNLEFLKEKHYIQNIDFTKIFMRPQTYKEAGSINHSPKKRTRIHGRRPLSVNDIETLKKTGFKHVRDWDSLTFLLPKEYKQFLQEIPEIVTQLKDIKSTKEDLKPLFCLSNTPSKKIRNRPISCDSNFFSTDCRSSNFSSTATQPSSGYRGSSTMLNSNNSNPTPSPRNPSFAFRYDSNDSVFNSSRKNTPQRSGSSLHSEGSDEPAARPPLPRSILRNNSLDNTKYTCKTQKDNANKRYSMIEFTEKNLENNDKSKRRKSTQDPYYLKSPQKNLKEFKSNCETEELCKNYNRLRKKDNYNEENCLSFNSSSLESDMRRLEELLEISAVFGESIESFTEHDMQKLRSQVSKFITMQKNLEQVSECLQTVNEKKMLNPNNSESDDLYKEKKLANVKHSQTPNNTPEHKKKSSLTLREDYETDKDECSCLVCGSEDCLNTDRCQEYDKDEYNCKEDNLRGLKKTVSFAEKISFLTKNRDSKNKDTTPPNSPTVTSTHPVHKIYQGKSLKLMDVPISEESCEGSPSDSPKKKIESNFSLLHKKDLILDVKNAIQKVVHQSKLKSDKTQEELSNVCLHHLCPSLYAVLMDGLKEEIDTPFGPIRNSVWSVIESASHQGPLTETLNQLVQRLNRDDILTEGLVKFNAFIFGLLNANALAAWLSYLRTRDGLLRKYYNNNGLLVLSNSAGAPVRNLMDQLIRTIQPLSEIKFNLDLMYQAKLLHCSLQNLNCLLEATNSDMLSPSKHLMLLKLVQSIQNSINQPPETRKGRYTSAELEKLTNDPAVPQLLEESISSRTQGTNKPRPRSGCDTLFLNNFSDVASSVKKRWSGVQFNSKLLQAFERLGEETESEYTDSLDNAKVNQSPSIKTVLKKLQNSQDSSDDLPTWNSNNVSSEIKTKEERKNILSNLNRKNISKLDEPKTDAADNDKLMERSLSDVQNGNYKFKRLQQKWEKLSGKSSSDLSSEGNTPLQGISPIHKSKLPVSKNITPERPGCDSNLISPTSRISRIPRPVSSPVQTTPTYERHNEKKYTSSSSNNNFQQKGQIKSVNNYLSKADSKTKSSNINRISRLDEVSECNSSSSAIKSRAVRPSSLPYRGVNTSSAKKNVLTRASSMSLNRKPDKKPLNISRVVRTLSHRLPSDSGHLSFNEGEKLRVVLEVDETWLLCCRGTQKGLVPKSAVIPIPEHVKY